MKGAPPKGMAKSGGKLFLDDDGMEVYKLKHLKKKPHVIAAKTGLETAEVELILTNFDKYPEFINQSLATPQDALALLEENGGRIRPSSNAARRDLEETLSHLLDMEDALESRLEHLQVKKAKIQAAVSSLKDLEGY